MIVAGVSGRERQLLRDLMQRRGGRGGTYLAGSADSVGGEVVRPMAVLGGPPSPTPPCLEKLDG